MNAEEVYVEGEPPLLGRTVKKVRKKRMSATGTYARSYENPCCWSCSQTGKKDQLLLCLLNITLAQQALSHGRTRT